MKTDYQRQLNDYKKEDSIKEKLDKINRIKELLNNKMKKHDYSEYSDNEIEDRIEEIEDILSKNFDELGQNLGIELSEETRISIKNVIGKTNQLFDYEWENTIRLLERNYQKLPKPYLSIHIRNTDYQCDYKKLYNENKELIHQYKSIYIATDDKFSLEFFKERGLTIYNFTTVPDIISENLHYSEDISGDIKIKDLISDLYLMSMSDKLLSNSKGGFIELIRHCIENADLINDKFKG